MATGTVTLALNGALGTNTAALLLVLVLATLMAAEVGLMLGSWAKDTKTLYTVWKSGAIVLVAPVVFFIWPNLPQWIAKSSQPTTSSRLCSTSPSAAPASPTCGWNSPSASPSVPFSCRRLHPRPPYGSQPGCGVASHYRHILSFVSKSHSSTRFHSHAIGPIPTRYIGENCEE